MLNQTVREASAKIPVAFVPLNPVGTQAPTELLWGDATIRAFSDFAADNPSAAAYGEDAFHYFLEVERRRSEASNHAFLLMLIDFKVQPGKGPNIPSTSASALFASLRLALRETDFYGWYRDGRVAGAVLTQHGEPDGP